MLHNTLYTHPKQMFSRQSLGASEARSVTRRTLALSLWLRVGQIRLRVRLVTSPSRATAGLPPVYHHHRNRPGPSGRVLGLERQADSPPVMVADRDRSQ